MVLSWSFLPLAALLIAACGSPASTSPNTVVASTPPIADLLRAILAEDGEVVSLVPAGVEPHDHELTAADRSTIENADLVVYIGEGFQPAVERAVTPTRSIDLLEFAGTLRERSDHDGDDDDHDGDQLLDPHVWLDPVRWAAVARALGEEVADRLDLEDLVERADSVATSLESLNDAFLEALANCSSLTIVSEHAAFGYLVDRYGLAQRSLTGVSKESEATAPAIRAVRDFARAEGVTTVFTEPGSEGRLARTLAEAAGLKVATLDPLELADVANSYHDRMRANLVALEEALTCR